MGADSGIELIVRAVCVVKGEILLCRSRGTANTYLPGGHVEFGESAAESLRREIREELGQPCAVGRFLGAVEHTFKQKGERHCEVNLVFEVRIHNLKPGRPVPSREHKIEFEWALLRGLSRSSLEPSPLRKLVKAWTAERRSPGRWASTIA